MKNCEFYNPQVIDDHNNELKPLNDSTDLETDSTVIFKNFECETPETAGYSVIEKNEMSLFYREEITTGDFLIGAIGLFIIILLFIDLIERRLLPRFVRFWK